MTAPCLRCSMALWFFDIMLCIYAHDCYTDGTAMQGGYDTIPSQVVFAFCEICSVVECRCPWICVLFLTNCIC